MFSAVWVAFFSDVPDSSFWDGAIEQRAQASVQTPHPMALNGLLHTVACRGRQRHEVAIFQQQSSRPRSIRVVTKPKCYLIQHCKHISASPLTKPLDMPSIVLTTIFFCWWTLLILEYQKIYIYIFFNSCVLEVFTVLALQLRSY